MEFLDTQATIECRFTLKRVREMIIKYSKTRKVFWRGLKDKSCLFTLDSKISRSYVRAKHCAGREFQSLAVRGKKLLTKASL